VGVRRVVRGDGMVTSGSGAVKSVVDGSSRHTLQLHSTPYGWGTKLVSWLDAAWVRGDKVLVEHAPGAAPDVRRGMVRAGLDVARPGHGRVELVDARVLGARCGGRAERWYEWHAEYAGQAVRDGYAGLAMIVDGSVMRELAAERVGPTDHERDIGRLVTEHPIRAVCCYHLRTDHTVPPDVLVTHHRDLLDEGWSARVLGGELRVRGEIDASNADRLYQVLRAARDRGITVVNLSELTFAAAAGVRAFAEAAESLAPDQELILVKVAPALARIFRLTGYDLQPGLRLVPRADNR
jgi:anti-anti-sigma factor